MRSLSRLPARAPLVSAVLSCAVLSCAVLSCAVLSCAVLSCATWASPCAPLPLSEEVKASGALSYIERAPSPNLPESPIVIALHGLGHHKRGFAQLAARLPSAWRVISVDAPWRYGRGFAWYRYRCPEAEADLTSSTARLLSLSRSLMSRYPKAPKPAVFGFSQGGVMSLSALNAAPELWSSVGSLSGYWLPQEAPRPQAKTSVTLVMAHGDRDQVVRFKRGERAAALLSEAGYAVHWLPFVGEHRVDAHALQQLIESFERGWLAR